MIVLNLHYRGQGQNLWIFQVLVKTLNCNLQNDPCWDAKYRSKMFFFPFCIVPALTIFICSFFFLKDCLSPANTWCNTACNTGNKYTHYGHSMLNTAHSLLCHKENTVTFIHREWPYSWHLLCYYFYFNAIVRFYIFISRKGRNFLTRICFLVLGTT